LRIRDGGIPGGRAPTGGKPGGGIPGGNCEGKPGGGRPGIETGGIPGGVIGGIPGGGIGGITTQKFKNNGDMEENEFSILRHLLLPFAIGKGIGGGTIPFGFPFSLAFS